MPTLFLVHVRPALSSSLTFVLSDEETEPSSADLEPLTEEAAAIKIQSIWRMHEEREIFLDKQHAAKDIQKVVRGNRQRGNRPGKPTATGTATPVAPARTILVGTIVCTRCVLKKTECHCTDGFANGGEAAVKAVEQIREHVRSAVKTTDRLIQIYKNLTGSKHYPLSKSTFAKLLTQACPTLNITPKFFDEVWLCAVKPHYLMDEMEHDTLAEWLFPEAESVKKRKLKQKQKELDEHNLRMEEEDERKREERNAPLRKLFGRIGDGAVKNGKGELKSNVGQLFQLLG